MRFALRAGALGLALALLAAGFFVPLAVEGRPGPPGTELPPPATGGITKLDPLLQKLTNNRRLLIVGAHPDDENSALLAVVSRKLGGEAAYLSLTRGEGGQNLIGDELGVGLGLIRTQELLAARRLDGARQFFTRAYDFGFSKSLDEALRFWPKKDLLEDAVRVVRRFRPQVLFVTFTGTPADGHGQHSASAVVAHEAFQAAGDASAFPELSREGLPPWKPKTLLRSNWFDDQKKGFPIPTGDVEPLTGKSYAQIAVASRSLHHSQGTGALQRPGPNETGAIWLDGTAGSGGQELFAGVDTRLRSIAADVTDAPRRAKIEALLDGVQSATEKLRARLSPATIRDAAPALAGMLRDLRASRAMLTPADAGAAAVLDEKVAAAEAALATAAEVTLDALAETETAVEGEAVPITASVWNAGGSPVEVESVALESPDGWTVSAAAPGKTVAAGKLEDWKLEARVPASAPATIPYFLRRPLRGSLYDWTGVPESVKGEPFAPPAVTAVATVRIGGESVRLSREATLRIRDEVAGEIRHSLRAVPRLDVSVEPASIVWPLERRRPRPITVTVTSNAKDAVAGNVEIGLPPRWPALAPAAFSLAKKGDRAVIEIPLLPPESLTPGKFDITVAAVAGRERFATSVAMIDYEHIRPTPQPRAAQIAFSAVDLKLPKLASVGYVRGAADRVPEALLGVGVPIRLLTDEDLERGDLTRYDAILIGSRAYETDPGLARANGRLLAAVRAGGLLIVQYQQYPFIQGGYAPYALEIARPHDRVTDETAKVTILEPADPLWSTPNRIGPQDWDGWVQERGLYFAHTWAPEYTPMLAMSDPGAPETKGSLLAARVGKGRYVYTGLAFFRQLPAGVPGAYRLIANLLGWR